MSLIRRGTWNVEDCAYQQKGRLGDPCCYCGQEANTLDHIPPLTAYQRMDHQDREHCNPVLVPACLECNQILGSNPALSIRARRSIVKARLRKRYRKFLNMPMWDEDELAELDARMADDVRRSSYFAEHIKQRLGFYNGK